MRKLKFLVQKDFCLNPVHTVLLFLIILVLYTNDIVRGQERCAIILKDNKEIVGEAFFDSTKKVIVIKTLNGKVKKISITEVLTDEKGMFITGYQNEKIAPVRITLPIEIDTCRIRGFVFGEMRGVGMYSNNFYYGGETALGFRLGKFLFGAFGGVWNMKDEWRFPIGLHLKVELSESCVVPFISADVGYVYDNIVSDYNLKPSINNFRTLSPKFAGIGVGLDFPLARWLDLSIDGGYRYITIAERRFSTTCFGNIPVVGFTEIHAAYFRLGITF